jgi:predicted GNAT family acetyltransferase
MKERLARRRRARYFPTMVQQNTALSRFEIEADGATAIAVYRVDVRGNDKVMTFTHTEVPEALRGRGIASVLIKGALAAARAQGFKVVPQCPFVARYIDYNPEWRDLVA